ncbi:hypothetical protein PR048_019968 [Dryococelus australis]|uniref:PiggyBac transposable element-derived protein domain-containing protein n=1 Tax=Dryococelus australis TaxID=614101 RepID=A0ABQ9H4Z0_9NEOP|nr:hypothetical protein PR048_019968 [Dryococelus australis]
MIHKNQKQSPVRPRHPQRSAYLEVTNLPSAMDLDSDNTDVDPDYQPRDISQRNSIFVSATDSTDSEGEEIISEKVFKNVGRHNVSKNVCIHKTFSENTEIDIKYPLNMFLQFITIAFIRGQTLDLTFDELKTVFGILIIMEFHSLPTLSLYWSGDHNFHDPRIAKIMSLKRFLKMLRFIQLNDNSCMPNKDDPNFTDFTKLNPSFST